MRRPRLFRPAALAAALPFLLVLVFPGPVRAQDRPPELGFSVIRSLAHDPSSFTQGLVLDRGVLYEGTGLYGRSKLRRLDPESGKVLGEIRLDKAFFGEGVTLFKGLLYQLTWREKQAFAYDPETLELVKSFPISFSGWGLTHDGKRLIATDGSADLIFLDPETLAETSRMRVTDQGRPLLRLNELEYVNGQIYANVWMTDRIARIDPESGRVTGWIVLSDISRENERTGPGHVLNGIAADEKTGRFWVTGKCWPRLYEIELLPGN